jgi:hypothetical protein
MHSTPATTKASAPPRTTKRAALKPSSSPKRKAPQMKTVIMFNGVHEPAARDKPIASDALKAE